MNTDKDEWHTIGNDNKFDIIMRPHDKEMWDFRTMYRFSQLPSFVYPMFIDLAKIHPGVKFRSSQGGNSSCYTVCFYPSYLEWSAVIYFMKAWLQEQKYQADLMEEGDLIYLKVKIKGRNNKIKPKDYGKVYARNNEE